MNSERFKKAEEIYHAALEIEPDERALFLDRECSEDLELRNEIESLLSFEKNPTSFIDGSPEDLAVELLAKKDTPENLVNKRIGRYQVEKILGVGGMGTVYLATDTRLARPVALKVLPSEIVKDRDRIQRFMHEARAASALNHPHILTVYEFDEFINENDETLHFISMEFVEGKTLDNLIYSEKASTSELFKYLAQAAKGLAKAHSAGIVHRDLKPENIMVSNDGYAKILDFGLAKLTDTEHELHVLQQHKSRSGVILGTLGYMSPEQAQGKRDIDERSDVFALGCVLYEAAARRKAFEADSAIDSLHKIIHAEPPPLKEFNPDVSLELEELVARCLKKDPKDRYRNTAQIARLLENISTETIDRSKPYKSSNEAKTKIREKKVTRESPSQSFSGQRRQVTAMFIDASAISDMLEDFDPERSLQIMNDLWGTLDNLITNGGGRISEHLAGTNLAVWGTEMIRESDPENAVRTALELQKTTNEFFNKQLSGEFKFSDDEKEELSNTNFLKIAISTGTVLVGDSTDTGEFLSTGLAVSAAKRLVSKASIGEVFVSSDTYRHIRGVFEVEEVSLQTELPFKRKKHETKTYSIKGIKPKAFRMTARGVEGIETLLVGREAELIRLLDALEAVKEDKELQVVTVVGEAGLGKSRLLFEFHDQLELAPDRFYVFKARALESMQGMPFSLVRDLFFFRFEIQENDSEAVARKQFVKGILAMALNSNGIFGNGETAEMKAQFIGQLIGIDFSGSQHIKEIIADEKQIQDRAFVYSSQFFAAVSQQLPAVFYLDDLHWADDESLNFFDHVTRECSDEAILVTEFTRPTLYERRPHWGEGESNRIRLNLQPLTKRQSGKLIGNILQKATSIPKELVELLVSNTEGNPFYVEELIKMLIEQGAIKARGEEWTIDSRRLGEIAVPPTLTGVLQSRLDKLSPWEKRILQRASVVGREFWDTSLKSFEEEINVPAVLESLRRKELLFRKENSSFEDAREYIFKHALLRDVTYETVLLEERRQWHLESAEWLVESRGERRNEYLTLIAEHFEKAEEHEKSAYWHGKAGDQARRSYALETAEKHLRVAMEFWQQAGGSESALISYEQIMKWKHSLGRVYYAQARYADAIKVFADLLEMAKSLGYKLSQAYAYWGLSYSQFESGETRSSLESAKEMVRLTRDGDLADAEKAVFLLAMGFYRQGRALISLGEFEEAISLTENNLESLAASRAASVEVKANRLHLLAAANMFLGRFGEAQKFESEEVEISRAAGDLRTVGNGLNSLGFQSYMQGHGKKAIHYYEEALEIAREIGSKSNEIMVRSNICGAKVLLGKFQIAESELRTLIDELVDNGHFLAPEMYRFLTEALIGQGKFREALETATKSLALSLEAENQETIGEAWRVLGIISSCLHESISVSGDSYSAAECFEKALTIFENLKMEANYAQTLHNLARHHSATGNQPKAEELLGREKEISDSLEIDTAAKSIYFDPQV